MQLTASQISKVIQGEIIGDSNTVISSFSDIKNAQKNDLTFLADIKHEKYLKSTNASIIIVPTGDIKCKKTIIKTDQPTQKFIKILNLFFSEKPVKREIAKSARIHKKSEIGKECLIGENCVVQENVKIEKNCIIGPNTFIGSNTIIKQNCQIGPNVTIYNNSEVGEMCIIHAGVIIGGDGFGFFQNEKKHIKIPQLGKVIIKNDVEIGANTTIDRGTLHATIINDGVKLDNLIQIGHNVKIGSNTIIAAQTGIAGSVTVGRNCMIGGQVAIADHIQIGNNVKIAGKSGVIKNIENNKTVQGPLAFDIKEFQKAYIHFKNLKKLTQDIQYIKKHIAKNNKK